jgi:hypothetical protein
MKLRFDWPTLLNLYRKIWIWQLALLITLLALAGHFWPIWHQPFDPVYLQNWYDHSQWSIPLSPRTMGDGPLYLIAGWRIIHGDDLFHINPESPPLGKYLIGWSAQLTGSPYTVNILYYGLLLLGVWCLARQVFREPWQRWLSVWLLAIQPLVFTQLGETLLDLPQVVLVVWHMIAALALARAPRQQLGWWLLLAAATLGGFISLKIGVLAVAFVLMDLWLLVRARRWWLLPPILVGAVVVYLVVYTPYFLSGHSLTEWVRAQKWIGHFYLSAQTTATIGMTWITQTIGWYQGWWGGGWEQIREWTWLWPLGLVAWGAGIWHSRRPLLSRQPLTPHHSVAQLIWPGLLIFSSTLLALYTVIPYWPRYTLLLLPIFVLCVVRWLPQRPRTVWVIVAVLTAQAISSTWAPLPAARQWMTELWGKRTYAELYDLLDPATRPADRQQWAQQLVKLDSQLQLSQLQVELAVPEVAPWENRASGQLTLTYLTPLGPWRSTHDITLQRHSGRWWLPWSWNLVMDKYDPQTPVYVELDRPQSGIVFDREHRPLLTPAAQEFLSIIPGQLTNTDAVLTAIDRQLNISSADLRIKLFIFSPSTSTIPVGFLPPTLTTDARDLFERNPGIIITKLNGVKYHSLLLSPVASNSADLSRTTTVTGTDPLTPWQRFQAALAKHPEVAGSVGGRLRFGTDTLLSVPVHNGVDVTLPDTYFP